VVVAGLGDSGLLTAIRLARSADVVGISAKPALVSGQEHGVRLTRPADWASDYLVPFDRYRALDTVRTLHAELTGVDLAGRTVHARQPDGTEITGGTPQEFGGYLRSEIAKWSKVVKFAQMRVD
jgi:hypothetical protein